MAPLGQHGREKIKYHAKMQGRIVGDIRLPFFLSHDRELAEMYAAEDAVPAFQDLSKRPLTLDTPEKFVEAWQASGADNVNGDFHPNQMHAFAEWVRPQGHDAVVIPTSAFEGDPPMTRSPA